MSFDSPSEMLNLANLRTITGGDLELEKSLFEAFLAGSEKTMTKLINKDVKEGDNEFRQLAHSLKGEAANLGAEKLATLCRELQTTDSSQDREKLLMQAQQELKLVTDHLRTNYL